MLTIVDIGTENDLRVHSDAARGETLQAIQNRRRFFIVQHGRPENRVGGVNGNVQRTETLSEYPLPVRFGECAESYKVAVQKGSAEIIILDVQRVAAAGGHLIDKAEDALITTALDRKGAEFEAESIVGILDNGISLDNSVSPAHS